MNTKLHDAVRYAGMIYDTPQLRREAQAYDYMSEGGLLYIAENTDDDIRVEMVTDGWSIAGTREEVCAAIATAREQIIAAHSGDA
jgi:hypothetical protein